MLFNAEVLAQYIFAVGHYPPSHWATPTLGGMLRYFLSPQHKWLQFVPTVAGLIWFIFHWLKERRTWNWVEQMPTLVAISVLTTSYGWTFDYVVLLLVVVPMAAAIFHQGMNRVTILVTGIYLIINALYVAFCGRFPELLGMWLAPALVGWYFLAVQLGVLRFRP